MIMIYLEFLQNKKLEKLNSSLDVAFLHDGVCSSTYFYLIVFILSQVVSGKYYTPEVVAKQ